ncbi:DUF1573 domain-containing protein [Melioribacteraceae bacterium 4301-Me]|uniref:DUF1573 domain-containing protein n=1 Tax=Pyranulibacter aquaticus TaxID=3163344 RepID=UPI00359A0340
MKKLFLLLFVMTFSFVYSQNHLPKIKAINSTKDLGTLVEGQIVKESFVIKNEGDADLRIDKVRASCGCTAAEPAKKELKPGEQTAINVEFNSAGRLGLQQKFVYVFSNDPKTPELRLAFTAVVVSKNSPAVKSQKMPHLKLEKNEYDFGNVKEGKIVTAIINFTNTGEGDLTINDVRTSCGCTAALLSSKNLKPGERGSLRIELDTSNREGKLARTVTLYTNDPDTPNPTITLFVNIEKR